MSFRPLVALVGASLISAHYDLGFQVAMGINLLVVAFILKEAE